VELIVVEPSKEQCNTFNNTTRSGGHRSVDSSRGLGPQEYFTKVAQTGKYQIMVKVFSTLGATEKGSKLARPVTTSVDLFLRSPSQATGMMEHYIRSVSLFKVKQEVVVFEVDWQ